MKKIEWSEEKIEKFVSDGWSLSYDKTNDRFKLQKWMKGRVKSYSLPKHFNEFCWKLKEELKNQAREPRDLKEEDVKKQKKPKTLGYQQAGTGRKITLKALDRSHARIVQNVTERISWFADVLNEIGFYATLLAMQVAKVPPEELYTRIEEFDNPQRFVAFVREYLNVLFEAKEEAQEIIKYREKLMALEGKLAVLEEVIDHLKRQRDEAFMNMCTVWYAAIATMDRDQLWDFISNIMLVQYSLGVKPPRKPEKKEQHA